jgi:hypothetical protein
VRSYVCATTAAPAHLRPEALDSNAASRGEQVDTGIPPKTSGATAAADRPELEKTVNLKILKLITSMRAQRAQFSLHRTARHTRSIASNPSIVEGLVYIADKNVTKGV